MAHQVLRLLESVYNSPQLVTESAFRPIVDYLHERAMSDFQFKAVVPEAKTAEAQAEQVGGIGEIKIDGVMTYKPVHGLCGPTGTSYQGILEQAEQLIAGGVDTIVMVHSSAGGQASHCFATARELRDMCDDAGVKLISYIDTHSCSASLALGIVADEVIIHPSAETGSIGCVVALMDKSKRLAMEGLKPIFIASTAGKTAFDADGSFSESFLKDVQEDVTRLGNEFANHVAEFTGLQVDEILAMDAKTFHAQAALEKGLVNAVMDHKQFAAHLHKIRGNKDA